MTHAIIIASVALLLSLLLFSRIRLVIRYNGSRFSTKLCFLLFRKKLFPLPEEPKPKKSKKKKKEIKQKKNTSRQDADTPQKKKSSLDMLRGIRALIEKILIRMPNTFSLKMRRLIISVAANDPAKTALLYGVVSQALAYFLEWADERLIRIKPAKPGAVNVYADFEKDKLSLDIDLVLYSNLLRILKLGIAVFLPLLFRKRKKKSASDAVKTAK